MLAKILSIKKIIKELGMRCKRMKRGVAGKPDEYEYEVKLEKLEELKKLDEIGEIDLKYLDEAGFSLMPSIPYEWQEKDPIILTSSHSKRLNVLAVINRKNEIDYQVYKTKLSRELLIFFG